MREMGGFQQWFNAYSSSEAGYMITLEPSSELMDNYVQQMQLAYDYLNVQEDGTKFIGFSPEHVEARKVTQELDYLNQVMQEGQRFLKVMNEDLKRLRDRLRDMEDPNYDPNDSDRQQQGERSLIQI